jgi:hypothetical protein
MKQSIERACDCSGCDRRQCRGGVYHNKRGQRMFNKNHRCPGKIPAKSGWKVIEIAEGHPTFPSVLPKIMDMVK